MPTSDLGAGRTGDFLVAIDAADYFERLGFVRTSREQAPESLRSTPEFSSLCPGSAQLMRFGID